MGHALARVAATLLLCAVGTPVVAQSAGVGTPETAPHEVTNAFFEAVGTHQWSAAAQALHPETLALFRYRLNSMLDADTTGRLAPLVFNEADGPDIRALDDEVSFATLLRAIESTTPALIAVLATNRYHALGHVPEPPDLAHVVVRVTPYTTGSAPTRTFVVTLKRAGSAWRILESGELDALATAMTGLALKVKDARAGQHG